MVPERIADTLRVFSFFQYEVLVVEKGCQ